MRPCIYSFLLLAPLVIFSRHNISPPWSNSSSSSWKRAGNLDKSDENLPKLPTKQKLHLDFATGPAAHSDHERGAPEAPSLDLDKHDHSELVEEVEEHQAACP